MIRRAASKNRIALRDHLKIHPAMVLLQAFLPELSGAWPSELSSECIQYSGVVNSWRVHGRHWLMIPNTLPAAGARCLRLPLALPRRDEDLAHAPRDDLLIAWLIHEERKHDGAMVPQHGDPRVAFHKLLFA